ncbi:hypothetical protein PTTG_10315, partial [Puccinia triticina 1-1 BBBD Race 1]
VGLEPKVKTPTTLTPRPSPPLQLGNLTSCYPYNSLPFARTLTPFHPYNLLPIARTLTPCLPYNSLAIARTHLARILTPHTPPPAPCKRSLKPKSKVPTYTSWPYTLLLPYTSLQQSLTSLLSL